MKTITLTLMTMMALMVSLFPLVTSARAGTLRDDFEDGNADGWRKLEGLIKNDPLDQSTQWFVENGELVSSSQDVCTWGSYFGIGDNTWRDYEFEFEFRVEEFFPNGCGNWAPFVGFGVRYDTSEGNVNGVAVLVANNRAYGERVFNGRRGPVDLDRTSVGVGKWYTAKAVVAGNHFQMFIGDQLLWDTKYDPIDAGAAVFTAQNCEVHFDNVIITGDDIPDTNLAITAAAAEPRGKLAMTWGTIKTR